MSDQSKRILERNQKLKAGLRRAQNTLRSWMTTEAWAELCERFGDRLDKLNADLRAAGFEPPGGDVENWAHLARVIERDPDLMANYEEIRDWAIAWVDRQLLKVKLVGSQNDSRDDTFDGVVTIQQVCRLISISTKTIQNKMSELRRKGEAVPEPINRESIPYPFSYKTLQNWISQHWPTANLPTNFSEFSEILHNIRN